MKTETSRKLYQIAEIWNNFFLEYKYFNKAIKAANDIKSNYLGDIFGYFQDTLEIIYTEKTPSTFSEIFAYHISFLQAIYIQQDFIEELLKVFRTKINRGNLDEDENFSLNRNIRNELIGHPIRRINIAEKFSTEKCSFCGSTIPPKKKSVLLSSTLFSNNTKEDTIEYLLYHQEKKFKVQIVTHKISDIVDRHDKFLNEYLNTILKKLKQILKTYDKELPALIESIERKDFDAIIRLASTYFESIFRYNYAYDKDLILIINSKRNEHFRYQNFINSFCDDLFTNLISIRHFISEILLDGTEKNHEKFDSKQKFSFSPMSKEFDKTTMEKGGVNYSLRKLFLEKSLDIFLVHSRVIIDYSKKDKFIINELNHMKLNLYDSTEYYPALKLICNELEKNDYT